MTTEEEKNVIGGVVLEYAEVKRQLVALNEKLGAALTTVRNIEEAVRQGHQNVIRMFENWPTAQTFTDLLNEIETKSKRKTALEKTMKEYGIDL